jgi:hypothetical protein
MPEPLPSFRPIGLPLPTNQLRTAETPRRERPDRDDDPRDAAPVEDVLDEAWSGRSARHAFPRLRFIAPLFAVGFLLGAGFVVTDRLNRSSSAQLEEPFAPNAALSQVVVDTRGATTIDADDASSWPIETDMSQSLPRLDALRHRIAELERRLERETERLDRLERQQYTAWTQPQTEQSLPPTEALPSPRSDPRLSIETDRDTRASSSDPPGATVSNEAWPAAPPRSDRGSIRLSDLLAANPNALDLSSRSPPFVPITREQQFRSTVVVTAPQPAQSIRRGAADPWLPRGADPGGDSVLALPGLFGVAPLFPGGPGRLRGAIIIR